MSATASRELISDFLLRTDVRRPWLGKIGTALVLLSLRRPNDDPCETGCCALAMAIIVHLLVYLSIDAASLSAEMPHR
jgi:hypothetical protein